MDCVFKRGDIERVFGVGFVIGLQERECEKLTLQGISGGVKMQFVGEGEFVVIPDVQGSPATHGFVQIV